MRGKNHLRVGAMTLVVVGVAGVVPWDEPKVAVLAAGLFLFGKVAPDLDHSGSSITRSWGALSRLYSAWFVRPFARAVYRGTRTARDPEKAPTHRYFTHTAPAALLAGGLFQVLVLVGVWATAVGCALMIGGAARVYDRDWRLPLAVCAALLVWVSWDELAASPWLPAAALTVGSFAHALDDCTTKFGAPLAFPFQDDKGRRWAKRGTPEWMRYETGTPAETLFVWMLGVALVVWLWLWLVDPILRPAVG